MACSNSIPVQLNEQQVRNRTNKGVDAKATLKAAERNSGTQALATQARELLSSLVRGRIKWRAFLVLHFM